jgi:hypothetical protein
VKIVFTRPWQVVGLAAIFLLAFWGVVALLNLIF